MSFEDRINTLESEAAFTGAVPAWTSHPEPSSAPQRRHEPDGARKLPARWITPVYNQRAIEREDKAIGSAGGGSIRYWEYHGSLAGVICKGPVDFLEEIIIDGEAAWKGPLYRGDATGCATVTVDARRVLRFYWGGESQTVDPLLAPGGNSFGHEHPAYRGLCYIVLVNFFFGRECNSVPRIELAVRCKPPPVASSNGAAGIFDGQVSPPASLADFIPHARHTGWAWRT